MRFERIKEFFFDDLDFVAVQRVSAYILMIAGVVMLLVAAHQQYRGVTGEPALSGSSMHSYIYTDGKVTRDAHPEAFRGAMQFHWLYAGLTLSAGLILHSIIGAQDRCDPLAPDSERKQQD